MATLTLKSTNSNFSYIIVKNPNNKLLVKSVKKGKMYGFFSDLNTYNIIFQDGFDEISFKENSHQNDYINDSCYNSPLFAITAIKEFFASVFKQQSVEDIDNCTNEIIITSVEINNINRLKKMIKYFNNFDININAIDDKNFTLSIKTNKSIFQLLNCTYLFSYLIIHFNKISLSIDNYLIKRLIKAGNIISAPYFIRYFIKKSFIKERSIFNEIKTDIDNNQYNFVYEDNQTARLNLIKSYITDMPLIDFGCGDGDLIPKIKNLTSSIYFFDKNNDSLSIVKKKIKKYQLNGFIVNDFSTLINEIDKPFNVVLSEVIEHNDLTYVTDLITNLFNNGCCSIYITTPNKDFNQYYLLDDKRHEDHIFEFTKKEANDYFSDLANKLNVNFLIQNVGDEVNDISTSLFIVLSKHKIQLNDTIKKEEKIIIKKEKINEINTHTIFLTIGPSNCGKSYFCQNVLIPQLEKLSPLANRTKVNVTYISSDEIRRNLLNENLDKYDKAMLTVSSIAFDFLYKRLEYACQFPVNSEFIIIDTKGTFSGFREKIYQIADKYHYSVVPLIFCYDDYNDYSKYIPLSKFIVKDIQKTKEVYQGIKKNVSSLITIRSNDFTKVYPFESSAHELYRQCFVSNDSIYYFISDIHGYFDEFIQLISEDFTIENGKIIDTDKCLVLLGDYIDKGPKSLAMIDFIYDNLDKIFVLKANHENRLYKELSGYLPHVDNEYFTTFNEIDEEHKQKFLTIFNKSLPFIFNDNFIATHSPCDMKYLGKIDNASIRNQIYYKYSSQEKNLYEELVKINVFSQKLVSQVHIFGHIPVKNPGKNIDNRIPINGGNKLFALICKQDKLTHKEIILNQITNKEQLYNWIKADEKIILTEKEEKTVNNLIGNKVNFISGTMSPCDKMNNELESIESAIAFFKDNGINDIVMQPKYMGSRANMYLFKINEQSYMISRNGFKINLHSKEKEYLLYDKMRSKFNMSNIKCVIIDGELLPWKVLGNGLIINYKSIYNNIKCENEFINNSNFESIINEIKNSETYKAFIKDINDLSKKELADKYSSNYEAFMNVMNYNKDIVKENQLNEIYNQQLDLYGSDGELIYKPFAILKIIYEDNSEKIITSLSTDNYLMFNFLNEDQCYKFNLLNEEDKCIEQFKKYTVEDHYEGVVIKPLSLNESLPYMKVRNVDYLSIVYGYDYRIEEKYQKLLKRKSIKNKLKISKLEWKLGLELLKIKYDDINVNNEKLIQLYTKFIREIIDEEQLDPRL